MRNVITAAILATAALVMADAAGAQEIERRPVSIAQLMTAEEVEATGLRNLEPEQLAALSRWLEGYQLAVAQRVMETAEGEYAPAAPVIESRIDGGFDGWVGDTVFRLQNGQVWQQVSPSAKYHTAQSPRVTISRGAYRLQVEGVGLEIEVQRVK